MPKPIKNINTNNSAISKTPSNALVVYLMPKLLTQIIKMNFNHNYFIEHEKYCKHFLGYTQKPLPPKPRAVNFQNCDRNHFTQSAIFGYSDLVIAKSVAEPENSNDRQLAHDTPTNACFFMRTIRTPQESTKPKNRFCQFLSMVACDGKGFALCCVPIVAVSQPVARYRPSLRTLAVTLKSAIGVTAMIYLFIGIARTDRTNKISYHGFFTELLTPQSKSKYINRALANSDASFDRLNLKAYSRLTNPKQRYFYVCNNPSYIQDMTRRNGEIVRSASIFEAGLSTLLRLVTLFDSGEQGYKTHSKVMTMKTYLFAGIRRTDLSNQIHSLRISATSELEARAILAREYVLAFAGRINRTSSLTNHKNAVSISTVKATNLDTTNDNSGNRTCQTCGFFVPKIHQTGLLHPFNTELAVRLRGRTKASNRTNKSRRLLSVVDYLTAPTMGGKSNFTKITGLHTMKTILNTTQLATISRNTDRTFTVQGLEVNHG